MIMRLEIMANAFSHDNIFRIKSEQRVIQFYYGKKPNQIKSCFVDKVKNVLGFI